MILLKFDVDKLMKTKTTIDAYGAMGIGPKAKDGYSFEDEKVFGKRADVRNIFMSDEIVKEYSKHLATVHKKDKMEAAHRIFEWSSWCPTSVGPRYKKMVKYLKQNTGWKDLPKSVVAIATPDDPFYEESEDV